MPKGAHGNSGEASEINLGGKISGKIVISLAECRSTINRGAARGVPLLNSSHKEVLKFDVAWKKHMS